MVWVALAGIMLQVMGLSIAIRGVSLTYRAAFNDPQRRLWPDVWVACREWFKARVLRREKHAEATGRAAMTLSLSGRALGYSGPPDPGASASIDEQIEYLRGTAIAVRELVRKVDDNAARRTNQLGADLRAEIRESVSAAAQEVSDLKTAVIGHNGKGLREAAAGLTLTAIGVLLTAAGLPW